MTLQIPILQEANRSPKSTDNGVSSRMQSHVISLYDYVRKSVAVWSTWFVASLCCLWLVGFPWLDDSKVRQSVLEKVLRTQALPPPHNQIYSRFWYAFSVVLRKIHSVNPFNGNFCEPGRANSIRKRWNFHLQLTAERWQFYFSQLRIAVFEAVQRPCTMNVRNEPLHDMACVIKRETPLVRRWKLCEFQHRKGISVSGINLILWRGVGCWPLICIFKMIFVTYTSYHDLVDRSLSGRQKMVGSSLWSNMPWLGITQTVFSCSYACRHEGQYVVLLLTKFIPASFASLPQDALISLWCRPLPSNNADSENSPTPPPTTDENWRQGSFEPTFAR